MYIYLRLKLQLVGKNKFFTTTKTKQLENIIKKININRIIICLFVDNKIAN